MGTFSGVDRLIKIVRLARHFQQLSRARYDSFFLNSRKLKWHGFRPDYLVDLAKNRRVLHVGFLDSPLHEEKLRGGDFLHGRIRSVAAYAFGLDVDPAALEHYRSVTGDDRNCILDLGAPDFSADVLSQQFDLILVPEVLEHVRNPGLVLDRVRELALRNGGAEVCVTVPNALSIKGLPQAYRGVELVHPDHFAYYSPVTLEHALLAAGFCDVILGGAWHDRRSESSVPGLLHECVVALCHPSKDSPRSRD